MNIIKRFLLWVERVLCQIDDSPPIWSHRHQVEMDLERSRQHFLNELARSEYESRMFTESLKRWAGGEGK